MDESADLGMFALSDELAAPPLSDLVGFIGTLPPAGVFDIGSDACDAALGYSLSSLAPTGFDGDYVGFLGATDVDDFFDEIIDPIFGFLGADLGGLVLGALFAVIAELSAEAPVTDAYTITFGLAASVDDPSAEIPLPAAAPLLVAGLAALAWAGRRRRAD